MNKNLDKFLIQPGTSVNLKKIDTSYFGDLDKKQSKAELSRIHKKMSGLQQMLHAEKKQALLIILQAMDAGGKDGTIRDVMHGFNPHGCKVTSFGVPSAEESGHDFLWRVHSSIPAKGEVGIFNRSHFGDVLIVRVHNMVPQEQWSKRYGHINNFERMLADEGIRIVKFYLHISKEEQKKRLDKRLSDPLKHWKVDEADFEERKHWDKYMEAYQQVLEKCSTEWAPWYVIPSDKKWYRNLLVAQIIAGTLEGMGPNFPKPSPDVANLKNTNLHD